MTVTAAGHVRQKKHESLSGKILLECAKCDDRWASKPGCVIGDTYHK